MGAVALLLFFLDRCYLSCCRVPALPSSATADMLALAHLTSTHRHHAPDLSCYRRCRLLNQPLFLQRPWHMAR